MRLRDGTEAAIRPIRPDDKDRLRMAFHGLEPQSIYTRVFHAKKDLTAEELRRLTEPDPARAAGLVVTTGSGGDERIIASGQYVADGDGAEVAFIVEEDFHRMGLARILLEHLTALARERGIRRFHAFVLPENAAMLGVFRRSALAMSTKREDGLVRVTLEL